MAKLTGFIVYSIDPLDGEHFFSDAKKTLKEVKRQYEHSETTGVIDLSKIPDCAFLPKTGKDESCD